MVSKFFLAETGIVPFSFLAETDNSRFVRAQPRYKKTAAWYSFYTYEDNKIWDTRHQGQR
jgi:hypothetical protein